jgi:hypothetical protein
LKELFFFQGNILGFFNSVAFLTKKTVNKFSKIRFGIFIQDPGTCLWIFSHPGSKASKAPDPDPQHCICLIGTGNGSGMHISYEKKLSQTKEKNFR